MLSQHVVYLLLEVLDAFLVFCLIFARFKPLTIS